MLLRGVSPALLTPMGADGEVDVPALRRLVARCLDEGVDGVVALGTTGEFFDLDADERALVAETVIDQVAGRVPVVIGTTGTGLAETRALSARAARAGADGVLVLPPMFYPATDQQVSDYFAGVADAVDVPLLAYNFPAIARNFVTAPMLADLAARIPHFAGVKETVQDFSIVQAALAATHEVRPDFAVLVGTESHILPGLLNGASGTISGLANVAAPLLLAHVRAIETGDAETMVTTSLDIVRVCGLFRLANPSYYALKIAVGELCDPDLLPTTRLSTCGPDASTSASVEAIAASVRALFAEPATITAAAPASLATATPAAA